MRAARIFLAGLVACSDGTGPGGEASNGRVVFASREGDPARERQQIYAIDPDGGGRVQLTQELNEGYTILRSPPGGTRIAFFKVNLSVASGIYTMLGDGSDLTGPFRFDFTIHDLTPDAMRVVGVRDQTEQRRLAIGALRTGETTDLPTGDVVPGEVFWSPDGDMLGFTGRVGDGLPNQLYVMRADGTGLRRITNDESLKYAPSWSPSGRYIAFTREALGGSIDLYVVQPDGSGFRRIYPFDCHGDRPPWSPDGREVMCTTIRGETRAIVNVVSRDVRELFPSGARYSCQGWSPDGSMLLCGSQNGWHTMAADGSGQRLLIPSDGGAAWPVWLRAD